MADDDGRLVEHVQRMVDHAEALLADADILAEAPGRRSNAVAVIGVLALEVLLKAAIAATSRTLPSQRLREFKVRKTKPPSGHDYCSLWMEIPPEFADRVLAAARARHPGHADFSDLMKLLAAFNRVFTQARYQYEFDEGLTRDEQRQRGLDWIESGAPLNKADVAYYPLELDALTGALVMYLRPSVVEQTT